MAGQVRAIPDPIVTGSPWTSADESAGLLATPYHPTMGRSLRHLVIVLGDQLDHESAVFDGFESRRDMVWMAEVPGEATHVRSHKARIALFLAAMRQFHAELRQRHRPVIYHQLDDETAFESLAEALQHDIRRLSPAKLVVVEPGEWRVERDLQRVARECSVELDIRPDRHFFCSREQFADYAEGRRQLRMEFFYREQRKKTGVLMDGDEPVGGKWNYDAENRGTFGKRGPSDLPDPVTFSPNQKTRQVIDLVNERFGDHPGSLESFDWPVSRRQALEALNDFITHRLLRFGEYQDAMWTCEPYLYHARLSSSLNLKLLNPREVVAAAADAYHEGHVPLNAAEGFIRQILGWREYVRGVYWLYMPDYLERNALNATGELPEFYWTGETDMQCLRQCIGQTLTHGYAHHIQRLMVTGLYALLLGVDPRQVHQWYLAVYVDAVEWVELPNTLGMSQYADGGVMASKPYAATGKYIQRMSNYCQQCPYDPAKRTGDKSCPFTTLYWDFLMRHEDELESNPRMKLQVRNLDRLDANERKAIRAKAKELRGT